MAVVGPVFLDTSVLLAGAIDIGPASKAAQAVLDAVYDGRLPEPRTAWHCCLEFFAVATRLPEEYRLSPEQAVQILSDLVFGRLRVDQLPAAASETFFCGAIEDRVAGGRIYDAHIATTARLHGARVIVTDNRRHFTSLLAHGLRVLDSSQLRAELA